MIHFDRGAMAGLDPPYAAWVFNWNFITLPAALVGNVATTSMLRGIL